MAMDADDSPRIVTFHDDDVAWFTPGAADPGIPEAMAAAVTRKVVVAGPVGGNITINTMPPGHVVLPHRHDCDEVIYLLDGAITLDGRSRRLGAGDAVIIRADTVYGFRVGDAGVKFLIIRQREASMSMSPGSP
jgi:quercetin dioxygenase-like cupin family protein